MKTIVNSAESLSLAIGKMKKMYHDKKYLRVSLVAGQDRSLQQNSLFHAWIQQLVREDGEFTAEEYKARSKLRFFVPILRAECEAFAKDWEIIFPAATRTNPDQRTAEVAAMDLMRVSSTCTTSQFSRALEEMQKYFSTKNHDPVFLEFPEESK